jgi:tetratricopeptide (TPR) repeat protein
MIDKATGNLGLPSVDARKSQLDELRLRYELNHNDISATSNYLDALVDYYRIDNSIVNPQPMNDAVELMNKSIQEFPNEQERFQYILAMILTGAGRYNEAAIAFEGLLGVHNPLGTGSPMMSRKDVIYNIGESYYNAGNLSEAEKYFAQLNSIDSSNENLLVMKKKIALKKAGFR